MITCFWRCIMDRRHHNEAAGHLVKRQMYGRAKIDLLQARLIGAN